MANTGDTVKAKATLDRMRASLTAWLKYRKSNDAVASGKAPGKVDPAALRERLAAQRRQYEQPLADQLYQLLSDAMDEQNLPDPDVSRDPDAAAKLAAIAVIGRAEGEQALPLPQGMWSPGTIWPLALIGGVALVAMYGISSAADAAREHERIECIKSGACTDSGFYVKLAAIAGLGYVGWRMYGHHLNPKTAKGR